MALAVFSLVVETWSASTYDQSFYAVGAVHMNTNLELK